MIKDLLEVELEYGSFIKEYISNFEIFTGKNMFHLENASIFGESPEFNIKFSKDSNDKLMLIHGVEKCYEFRLFYNLANYFDILKLAFNPKDYYLDFHSFFPDEVSGKVKYKHNPLEEACFVFISKSLDSIITIEAEDDKLLLNIKTFTYKYPTEVYTLMDNIKEYRHIDKEENVINFICKSRSNELGLQETKISKFNIDYELHYNSDITKLNERMDKWMDVSTPNNRLVLFYGPPGTGKTNWIKNYVSSLNKNIIYIPPGMITQISDPNFISFIKAYSGSVIILEDCEQVLEKRENTTNTVVSDLLNLTDGSLADFLDLKIIATHNKDRSWIDSALMRKGRCFCEYEFRNLSIDKSIALGKSLNIAEIPSEEKALSWFSSEEDSAIQLVEEKKIGFS